MQPRNLERVSIQTPCSLSWEGLAGDAQKRFCGQCSRHVHNLSALRADEAEELLAQSSGRLCVTYLPGPDGRPLTLPEAPRPAAPRPAARARRGWDVRGLVRSFFAGAFGVVALLAGCSVESRQAALPPGDDDAGPNAATPRTCPEDPRIMGGITAEPPRALIGEVALDPPLVVRDAPADGAERETAER